MKFTLVPTTNNPNPNMETTLHFEKATTAVDTVVAKAFNRNHECVGVLAIDNKLCADGTVPMTQEMLDKMPNTWDAPISGYHDVQLSYATRIYVAEFDIPDNHNPAVASVAIATAVPPTVTTESAAWMISHNGKPVKALEDMSVRDLRALLSAINELIR